MISLRLPVSVAAAHLRAGPLAACLAICLAAPLASPSAQNARTAASEAGKSGLPLETTRKVSFTTSEGTWMSLDVSPDGRTIVFDLLGDIYSMSVNGGPARPISSGPAMDAQPRYSPDGASIVFSSDRSGAEQLWIMDADGGNPRQITRGDNAHYVSPVWTPDGDYVVVARGVFQTAAFTDAYDIYMYHVRGGTGLRLLGGGGAERGRNAVENFLGPAFGRNPRYLYFTQKRGGWGYNLQFPGWQVATYDRETGRVAARTGAYGSGMRPALSPDGKWLTYATRVDTSTVLRLRDLGTGDETTLLPHIQRDDQESRFSRDLLPGYAFTPDSRAIIISFGGGFWRVEVPSGSASPIPFTALVEQKLGPLGKFAVQVPDSSITVQQIRDARPSPDGSRLVFSALDRIWIMDLPRGTPRRLTNGETGEFEPVWSPDGRYIAFVTWSDDSGGSIQRIRAAGRGEPERLTSGHAFYQRLAYTPAGDRIVTVRGSLREHMEEERGAGEELVWIPAAGGDATVIAPVSGAHQPHFVRDSERVYFYDGRALTSMRFDGTDVREHVRVSGWKQQTSGPSSPPQAASEIIMAPDGRMAIATVSDNVYLFPVPPGGGDAPTISIVNPSSATLPVKRLTRVGGDFIGWSSDGKSIHYSLGHSYFTYDVAAARETFHADSSSNAASYEPSRVDVKIVVPVDKPRGTVALVNARVVTMKGDEVIDRGTVLVRDNRIAAVGPTADVAIPAGTRTFDLAGKTIIPGWVDIHAHQGSARGVHRSRVWQYMIDLAFGITTTRNPQTFTTDVLSYADMVATGAILGPRIYSTGPGVFSRENIRSLDDARDVLRRYSEYYDTHTVKEYETGQRNVRQWFIMAARELGLMPTTEGSLDLKMNITELLDGYPGHEHTYPIYPLYDDVVQLVARSGITYTPNLMVLYGGPWTENYWYEHYDIHSDAKVRRFMPHDEVDRRALRRGQWFRDDQYIFAQMAEQARKIMDAGGNVGLGAHGQMPGLGTHWELWSLASGGIDPLAVIRIGTISSANGIGLGGELGSLEVGKLADLQVLARNPLDDIRNTTSVELVMKNGRLYNAASLAEIWPRERQPAPLWWWENGR